MNKVVSLFLDRLAERLVALLAGLVSSKIEGFHASSQAEQQSDLEDLARQYEAAGKIEIATNLRKRALGLVSSNLASEAVEVVRNLTGEPLQKAEPLAERLADIRGLSDFNATGSPAKSQRQRASEVKKSANVAGDGL